MDQGILKRSYLELVRSKLNDTTIVNSWESQAFNFEGIGAYLEIWSIRNDIYSSIVQKINVNYIYYVHNYYLIKKDGKL